MLTSQVSHFSDARPQTAAWHTSELVCCNACGLASPLCACHEHQAALTMSTQATLTSMAAAHGTEALAGMQGPECCATSPLRWARETALDATWQL